MSAERPGNVAAQDFGIRHDYEVVIRLASRGFVVVGLPLEGIGVSSAASVPAALSASFGSPIGVRRAIGD